MRSESDERVKNNVMRHEYRVLSENEKHCMRVIKDRGLELYEFIDKIAEGSGGSRELSLAKTKLEECVMWAVKHLTR